MKDSYSATARPCSVVAICSLNLRQVADEGEARVILDEIAGASAASMTRSIGLAGLRLFPVTVTSGER